MRRGLGSYNIQVAGAGARFRELFITPSCVAVAFQSAGVKVHPEQAELLEKQVQSFFRRTTRILQGLPQRTIPIICMDANAK
eukprot:11865118-Heterocapsa_arctica.AAC.1